MNDFKVYFSNITVCMLLALVSYRVLKIAVTFSGFRVSVLLTWMCKACFIWYWLDNSSTITIFQETKLCVTPVVTAYLRYHLLLAQLTTDGCGQIVWPPLCQYSYRMKYSCSRLAVPQELNHPSGAELHHHDSSTAPSLTNHPHPQDLAFLEHCHILSQTFLLHPSAISCTNKCRYRVPD